MTIQNQTLKELATPNLDHQPLYPQLKVGFELKSRIIHLLQIFHGNLDKHLKDCYIVCLSMKPNGIFKDQER